MAATPPIEAIAIRRASGADAKVIAALAARTFLDSFAAYNNPADIQTYVAKAFGEAQITRELDDSDSVFFLAEVDRAAVGYAKMRSGPAPACVTGPRPLEIHRFYVEHAWHGRGVGPALMNTCLQYASQSDHATVWLGVWKHNPRALAFYRKWQFIEVGEHVFQLASDSQIDVVMARSV